MQIDPRFAVAHLWAAMADIPHIYDLKAAKGAVRALQNEIDRAERGLPPMMVGERAAKVESLRGALPTLCVECPLAEAA